MSKMFTIKVVVENLEILFRPDTYTYQRQQTQNHFYSQCDI